MKARAMAAMRTGAMLKDWHILPAAYKGREG